MNPPKIPPSRIFRTPLSLPLSLLIVGLLSATVIPPEELEANKPRILQTKSGNSLLLDWAAQPEVYYFMEASPDLSTWTSAKLLKDNAETGTLSLGTTISSDKAFFRLSLEGDPSSARLRADDDGDKIINLLEADADMDAFKTEASVDSDGDEIPDYWEQFHFGTLVHDASYVAITDGLTLDEAFAASTDPTKLDSDGDGWSDALELIWGWDPNYDQGRDDDKYSYLGDFDGDGINNGTELLNETNASDSADAPPSPPKFAVIDLGEVSDNQIKDLANNGWTLIRKNNGDFHRWHWGIEEALSPSIEDSHCAAINSSGIVVGEAEDLTSEAWIYNAVYWPTNSSSYTILPPANPDEDNGIWQGIHDITDSNKIGGTGFIQLSGVNTGSGMTGQLETGFDHELGSLSRGGSPDYKLNGISYAPDKINDQGSFIGIQRVYQNSSMIEYNAAVSVISGGSPRIHEQVYDINESDMVLAKDVSSPEGALLLADGTRVDLDLWDGEELSAMSSPSNPTDPLIILSNWSIYIQKQVIATDGSASLASIVDKSSFYIYDIWDIFPSSDYYSTSGEQLISPDGTMIATPMYHAPTGETRQLLLLKVDVDIDSDNTNGLDSPDRSSSEEAVEDDDTTIGKIIGVNDGDDDDDLIPDFADGFNLESDVEGSDSLNPVNFAQMVVEIPQVLHLDEAQLRFVYNDAPPSDISIIPEVDGGSNRGLSFPDGSSSQWTNKTGKRYERGSGRLRIWLVDAPDGTRNSQSVGESPDGHFVPADEWLSLDKIGFDGQLETATLYLEGVNPSESALGDVISLEIDVDGDGSAAAFLVDSVRVTVVDADVEENSSTAYGFDAYTSPGAPWVSVEVGETTSVTSRIEPIDTLLNDKLFPHSILKSIATLGTELHGNPFEVIEVTGEQRFESQSGVNIGTEVFVFGEQNVFHPVGGFRVATYELRKKSLAVVFLDGVSDDTQLVEAGTTGLNSSDVVIYGNGPLETEKHPNDVYGDHTEILAGPDGIADSTVNNLGVQAPYFEQAEIELQLNEIYSQAVVDFDVTFFRDEFDWDSNHNKQLDGSEDFNIWNNWSNETDIEFSALDFNYVAFVTLETGTSGQVIGSWFLGNRLGNIQAQKDAVASMFVWALSHEVGHGQQISKGDGTGGYSSHPFYHSPKDLDPDNVMNYTVRTKFRKSQWDEANPYDQNDPPKN